MLKGGNSRQQVVDGVQGEELRLPPTLETSTLQERVLTGNWLLITEDSPRYTSTGVFMPSLKRLVRLAVATASTNSSICSMLKYLPRVSRSAG